MSKVEMVLIRDLDCVGCVTVKECPVCASLVAEDKTGAHERFHAQSRRAS